MRRKTWRAFALAASLAAVTAVAQPATADPGDTGAITRYAGIAVEDALDDTAAPDDNLTCDPRPVVDGRMLTPRAPIVVGELYAHVGIAGHFKCASLDTSATYWLYGRVTDMYWHQGAYRPGASGSDYMDSVAGAATVNPRATGQYRGGDPALNTWHYTLFEAWTSTGRYVTGVSPLFYVAGL